MGHIPIAIFHVVGTETSVWRRWLGWYVLGMFGG